MPSPLAALVLLAALLPPASPLCSRKECKCRPFDSNVAAHCRFETRQRLTLEAGDFGEELAWVDLEGGKELRFGLGVLSRLGSIQRLSIRNVTKVFVQKHSFANLTSSHVLFEFTDSVSLLLEEGSFRSLAGPVSASIQRISHLVIQRAAFTWLSDLVLSDVAKLELLDEAFLLDNPLSKLGDAPLTTIKLERVNMESLGRSTFRSSAKEIYIVNSSIRTVKRDAFDAIEIRGVVIENSTVERLESGAFNDRTLVVTLRLTNVKVVTLASGALPSGSSQLVVENSRMLNVHKGAINITVAEVTFSSNSFGRIHSLGVHLQKWNSINLMNNTFKRLDPEAFSSPVQPPLEKDGWMPEYNFTGNILFEYGNKSFDFSLTDDVAVNIDNNYFLFTCHCDMPSSLDALITSTGSPFNHILFESGRCSVDQKMARCFGIEEGFLSMTNFTETFCQEPVACEDIQRDSALPPVKPIITSVSDVMVEDEIERERLILGTVFVIFSFGMVLVAFVYIIKKIKDCNYCGKARTILLSAMTPVMGGTQTEGLTPTNSVSRLSVHEYAELQRKSGPALEEAAEDKATQTLPEELTQELLEALKRLTTPTDCGEARHVIEHLYDLIKVEDRPGLVAEYAEPADTAAHHIYAELPAALASRPLPSKPSHL